MTTLQHAHPDKNHDDHLNAYERLPLSLSFTPSSRLGDLADDSFDSIVREKTSSHPKTEKRIEALNESDVCNGCISPDPAASHGDRVKTISKSGLQGFSR